jgi:hypothetical protein
VFVLLFVAYGLALPLEGETTSLLDIANGMLPQSDDESTVEAEVSEAIQHDVDMNVGESRAHEAKGNAWERKTVEAIDQMSSKEISQTNTASDDKLTAKLEADVKQAKAALAGPQKKKEEKLEVDKEAAQAMKDPKQAKKLRAAATQAELEMQATSLPVTLIDESSQGDDLGEDDFGADNLRLMDGSDSDIMKAIEQQIGSEVSKQIGKVPANTMDTATLKQLEQDKTNAEKFLDQKQKEDKAAAAAKIKAQLEAAQEEMAKAQDADRSAEESQSAEKDENDEHW